MYLVQEKVQRVYIAALGNADALIVYIKVKPYGSLPEGVASPVISTRAIFIALFIAIHLHPGPTSISSLSSFGSLWHVKGTRDYQAGRSVSLADMEIFKNEPTVNEAEKTGEKRGGLFLERHGDSSLVQAKGMQDDSRWGNSDSAVRSSELRRLRWKFAIEFDKGIPRRKDKSISRVEEQLQRRTWIFEKSIAAVS